MVRHIISHLKRRKAGQLSGMPEVMDNELRKVGECLMRFLDDPIFTEKRKMLGRPKDEALSASEKGRIFKLSPVISGLTLFHFRARLHKIGLDAINETGGITICAHLTNALTREGLLQTWWYDIDFAIKSLGVDPFFVGGEPTDRRDYFKRFFMQYGVSAAAFTEHGRRRAKGNGMANDIPSLRNPRVIRADTPITCIFIDRYVNNSKRINLEPQDIRRILSGSKFGPDGAVMDLITHGRPKAGSSHNDSEEGEAEPMDLLRALILELQMEAVEMAFPYFVLEGICWGALMDIKAACEPLLLEIFGKGSQGNSKQPWYEMADLVGKTFAQANGLTEYGMRDDRLLLASARALNHALLGNTTSVCARGMKETASSLSFVNIFSLLGMQARQRAEQDEHKEGDEQAGQD